MSAIRCPICYIEDKHECSHTIGNGYAVCYIAHSNCTEVWKEKGGYVWGHVVMRLNGHVELDVARIERLLLLK